VNSFQVVLTSISSVCIPTADLYLRSASMDAERILEEANTVCRSVPFSDTMSYVNCRPVGQNAQTDSQPRSGKRWSGLRLSASSLGWAGSPLPAPAFRCRWGPGGYVARAAENTEDEGQATVASRGTPSNSSSARHPALVDQKAPKPGGSGESSAVLSHSSRIVGRVVNTEDKNGARGEEECGILTGLTGMAPSSSDGHMRRRQRTSRAARIFRLHSAAPAGPRALSSSIAE